jgi:cyclic pyranopterin phosphate synthase
VPSHIHTVREPLDAFERPLRDLRISVTDRCNFRCSYCMPHEEYAWAPHDAVLTFEEVARLARCFLHLGVRKIRLTGGEPLVRQDLHHLVSQLAGIDGIEELSLTTNGALLGDRAQALRQAGLERINVSLDTLRPDRFRRLTRRGDLTSVLRGIDAAREAGLAPIKINTVVIRNFNDDEILDLVEYGRVRNLEVRFIEFMDVGNSNDWDRERTVAKAEILETIHTRFPLEEAGRREGRAPAVDYRFLDGTGSVGIIGSVTEPFCSSCTRGRLTADGRFVTCLFSDTGFDLKGLLRSGASDEALVDAIRSAWGARSDRYSDERWDALKAGQSFRRGNKIEMITLGG